MHSFSPRHPGEGRAPRFFMSAQFRLFALADVSIPAFAGMTV
jgi:hypothetical protein